MIRPIRNASTPMITKTIIASTKIVALCSKDGLDLSLRPARRRLRGGARSMSVAYERFNAFAQAVVGGLLKQLAKRAARRSRSASGFAYGRTIGAQLPDHLDGAAIGAVAHDLEAPGIAIGVAQAVQRFAERPAVAVRGGQRRRAGWRGCGGWPTRRRRLRRASNRSHGRRARIAWFGCCGLRLAQRRGGGFFAPRRCLHALAERCRRGNVHGLRN